MSRSGSTPTTTSIPRTATSAATSRSAGRPVGVYNVAAGNVGIARALGEEGLDGKAVFVGHELNPNSRTLLESGGMDFVIGHDVDVEVALSVETVLAHLDGRPAPPSTRTRVRVYTKYNCDG